MEKSSRERLLDAGLELLGTVGSARASARAAEDRAAVPHGSVRYHFGSFDGFLDALVAHLVDVDRPRPGESPAEVCARWLGPQRTVTRARYELTLLAFGRPELADRLVAGRDVFVATLIDAGCAPDVARRLVAALDGLVLDALLRGETTLDPTPLIAMLTVDG